MVCFAGCYFSSFSEEKANEAAISYLNDKYSEEFVAKEGGICTDSIVFGDNWYELTVVKKSEENEEPHREYTVCISTDRKYTILGDNVIFDYYNSLYEEYITPIIKKEMNDIPFVIIVESEQAISISRYGASSDAEIPKNLNDNTFLPKKYCEFEIFISKQYDIGQIPTICSNINNSLKKDDYRIAHIVILEEEEFSDLNSAKDKYWRCKTKQFYIGNKYYEVSE